MASVWAGLRRCVDVRRLRADATAIHRAIAFTETPIVSRAARVKSPLNHNE
jgi:hypothetical protein